MFKCSTFIHQIYIFIYQNECESRWSNVHIDMQRMHAYMMYVICIHIQILP